MAEPINILILYNADEDATAKLEQLLSFIKYFFPAHSTLSSSSPLADAHAALEVANVVIPLINQKYLSSNIHMQLKDRIFERLNANEVLVLPIMLTSSAILPTSPLKDVKFVFKNPLNQIADLDLVFSELVSKWYEDLPEQIKHLKKPGAPAPIPQPPGAPTPSVPITSPEQLADSLLFLNYNDQREAFQEYRKASYQRRFNPLNLFLLSGTPNCAHDLLVRSFLEDEQIDVERFFLDLHAFRSNTENIWASLKTTLRLGGRSTSASYVCSQILEMIKHNHVIIQMDNVHEDRTNYIAAINCFWQKLYQEYLFPKRSTLKFCLFVFVTDKACDCKYELKQFVPPDQQANWQQLVEIIPPISPIKRADLSDWTDILRRTRDDIKRKISDHFEAKIEVLLPNEEDSLLMLEMVEKIIKESQLERQKDLIYKKLDIWLDEQN